jgi:ABC-type Fe3+ transport system substrate-binding protein
MEEDEMKLLTTTGLVAGLTLTGLLAQSAAAQDGSWEKIAAAAKEEKIVVAASSTLGGDAGVKVSALLSAATGVSLELFTGRMAVAQEKIKVEQQSKNFVTDAMDSGGIDTLLLKKAGLLESIIDEIPALKEKDKFSFPIAENVEGDMLSILEAQTVVCVNTSLVKPEDEPKSFQDLLDPKWKGKIFLSNPRYTTAPEEIMLTYTKANVGLDENYFVKLYQNSVVGGTGGGGEAIDKLVRGEVAIAGFFPGTTCLKPLFDGAPVKPLDLKEGILVKPMSFGFIKNAPHPNATKVFLNWLFSKEGQTALTQITGLTSVRNDVPSVLPIKLTAPSITETFDDIEQAEARRSKNYMANLVGAKK